MSSNFDPRFDANKENPPGGPAVMVEHPEAGGGAPARGGVRALGDSGKRVRMCVVLDRSGSMQATTTSGEREDHGFTMWDLARHCGRVAAHSMRAGDTLAIIAYSTSASVVLRPTVFGKSVQERQKVANRVDASLRDLRADGCTNMSEAIGMAMDMMPAEPAADEHCAIVFVSDGEPQGDRHDPVRFTRERSRERSHVRLHTVSIGEGAKHPLMRSLAESCGGVYRFVSDGTMLGTTIVHTLANIFRGGGPGAVLEGVDAEATDMVVRALEENSTLRDTAWAVRLRDRLTDMMRANPGSRAPRALLHDVREEVILGLSTPSNYRKWGYAYILSLMFSLRSRQKSNFKDHSGEMFSDAHVDRIDRVFNDLPAVKPSAYRKGVSRPAPRSMAVYNDSHGGCFTGDCPVSMADGSVRPVRELRRGDRVLGGGVVERVLRTSAAEPIEVVAVSEGLRLTPYHPVLLPGAAGWAFPEDLPGRERHKVDEVYNILLRDDGAQGTRHSLTVNGVEGITLAHGIEDDKVAAHPFFGTSRVREWVMSLDADADGLVSIGAGRLVADRHPTTHMVLGLQAAPAQASEAAAAVVG